MILNNITPIYAKGVKPALKVLKETRPKEAKKKKNADLFSFNTQKPLLPQIDKALNEVTKEDYCSYVAYLREGGNEHPLDEIANTKASKQDNFLQYLYLLLLDSHVLMDYFREGEEPNKRYTPAEKKALMLARMEKSGRLWETINKHAGRLAGNFYEKTIQGEVINDIDEIAGRKRSNHRYTAEELDESLVKYNFPSGVGLYYDRGEDENKIKVVNAKISELPQNTSKVLRILLNKTASKVPSDVFKGKTIKDFIEYTKVEISVDDYLTYTKKSDRKNAKKALESALNDLYSISLDKQGVFSRHRWVTSLDTNRKRQGVYSINFSNEMMGYICSSRTKIHDFNKVLLSLSENQKVAYQLGRNLWYHYMRTQGEQGSNRLWIENLLDILTELPSVAEVRSKDRHLVQKIQEPFEKALDILVSIGYLNSWHCTKAKGERITDREQAEASFDDWLGWYIEYDLNLPPQDEYVAKRLAMKEKRKKKSEAARKANESKQVKRAANVRKQ
jgi:hypothetical protein